MDPCLSSVTHLYIRVLEQISLRKENLLLASETECKRMGIRKLNDG